jgi:hypothetical protein
MMAAIEPTSDELLAIVDFATAAAWAGLPGDPSDVNTAQGSLLTLLGAAGDPKVSVRLLGNIPDLNWRTMVDSWRFGDPAADASLVDKSAASLLGLACRLRIGAQKPQSAVAAETQVSLQLQQAQVQLAQAQAGQLSKAGTLKVKLSQVLSQAFHDHVETGMLDQETIDQAYARYEVIFGEGKLPPPDKTADECLQVRVG